MDCKEQLSNTPAWHCCRERPSDERELAKSYDTIIVKYPMQVLDASDGPQNQIESKPAIEAVVLDSDAENAGSCCRSHSEGCSPGS